MPTANDYRRVAVRLRSARDNTATLLQPVLAAMERSPFERGGGNLQRAVGATIAVSIANVAEILTELQLQIDEAVRRAQVCDGYARAVRSYWHSDDPDRRYPPRPAAWADHG